MIKIEMAEARILYNIALDYEKGAKKSGIEIKPNLSKAIEFFTQSANLGYAPAQYWLGAHFEKLSMLNEESDECSKSDQYNKKAFEWYYKAAKQDFGPALNNLGWLYMNGVGVDIDEKEAFTCYDKASEQNFASALNNLGWCYEQGKGIEKNLDKALFCYQKSAEQMDVLGIHNFMRCYVKVVGYYSSDIKYEKCSVLFKRLRVGNIKNLGDTSALCKTHDRKLNRISRFLHNPGTEFFSQQPIRAADDEDDDGFKTRPAVFKPT